MLGTMQVTLTHASNNLILSVTGACEESLSIAVEEKAATESEVKDKVR